MEKRRRQCSSEGKAKKAEYIQKRRQDQQYSEREKELNKVAKQLWRKDEGNREKERKKDRKAHSQRRLDEDFRRNERIRDQLQHLERRDNPILRRSERIRDRQARKISRENTPVREKEQISDRNARSLRRSDPANKRKEYNQIASEQTKRRKDTGWDGIESQFQKEIRLMPTKPCSSCGCLYYSDNITSLSRENLEGKGVDADFLDQTICIHRDNIMLCGTCKTNILKGKTPRLCLSNGLAFPEQPQELKELTTLEERLLALHIAFMQIKSVGSEKELKLKGNIVNVENDLDECAKAIPRRFDEMATVQIKFSRSLTDTRPVWYEVIRPAYVERAKKFLMQQELYKETQVESRSDFEGFDDDARLEFICPDVQENRPVDGNMAPENNQPEYDSPRLHTHCSDNCKIKHCIALFHS